MSYTHRRRPGGWVVVKLESGGKVRSLPKIYASEFPAERRAVVLNRLAGRRASQSGARIPK